MIQINRATWNYFMNDHPWSLGRNEGFSIQFISADGRLYSGVGDSERLFHFSCLPSRSGLGIFPKSDSSSIQFACIERQRCGDASQKKSEINQPPFRRRIIAVLFGFIYVYYERLRNFYGLREVIGRLLISICIVLILSTVGLWMCRGFPSIRGWWI